MIQLLATLKTSTSLNMSGYSSTFYLIAGILSLLLCFFDIFVTIRFFRDSKSHLQQKSTVARGIGKKDATLGHLRNIALCMMILGIPLSISQAAYFLSSYQDCRSNNDFNTSCIIIQTIYASFRTIGFLMLYTFFVLRFYLSFKDSAYQVNKRTIYILIILLVAAFIATSFSIVEFAILRSNTLFSLVIALLIFALFPIIISFLFAKKLYTITITLRRSVMHPNPPPPESPGSKSGISTSSLDMEDDHDDISVHFTERQITLLNTITKQTLLSSILAISLTLVWIILLIASILINIKYSRKGYGIILWLIVEIGDALFGILLHICSYIAVWFSFIFAQKEYQWCCNRAHQWCLTKFSHRAMIAMTGSN